MSEIHQKGDLVEKNEVARHCDFTMDNLLIQLENAFSKVTVQTCQKIINNVREKENMFFEEDMKFDEC